MKPITDCKQQEQDYRQKMSACNVSYRHKRSGPLFDQLIIRSIQLFLKSQYVQCAYVIHIFFRSISQQTTVITMQIPGNVHSFSLFTLFKPFAYIVMIIC